MRVGEKQRRDGRQRGTNLEYLRGRKSESGKEANRKEVNE
jgi:hypothetical protein